MWDDTLKVTFNKGAIERQKREQKKIESWRKLCTQSRKKYEQKNSESCSFIGG